MRLQNLCKTPLLAALKIIGAYKATHLLRLCYESHWPNSTRCLFLFFFDLKLYTDILMLFFITNKSGYP